MSLKNEKRIAKLVTQGSDAVDQPNRNERVNGGYTFYSSNPDDGEIVSKLIKPKYNEDELKKAVDVNVTELIGDEPTQRLDLVPRPVYNEALDQIEDLRETVESQSVEINELSGQINELEAVSASLLVDVDSERLIASTSQNQSNTINERYVSTVGDFQNALQKATLEAIQRVSLQAQVDGLNAQKQALLSQLSAAQQTVTAREEQIQLLEDQLFGKQAQTAKGATESVDGSFTILVPNTENQADSKLYLRGNHEKDSQGYKNARWVNGPELEIYNAKPIDISSVSIQGSEGETRWISFPGSQSIPAGEKRSFKFGINSTAYNGLDPKRVGNLTKRWRGKASKYNGNISVLVKWTDGTEDRIASVTTTLNKQRD